MEQKQKNKLEKLLSDKKLTEAGELIRQIVVTPLDVPQKGAALTGLTSAYIDMMSDINSQYRDTLKEAIAGMQSLYKAEKSAEDNAQISELKKDLGV